MKVSEIIRSCIFDLYPIVSIFILCLAYQVFLYHKNRVLDRKVILKHFLWVDIFLLYIALMFDVAGSGTIWVSSTLDLGKISVH